MLFKDRKEAALMLIPHLKKYENKKAIVLAVPRGGVPLGYHIAKHYNFPLDLLLTKKIGHPLNEELAIGAVSLEDHIIDPRHNIQESYIESKIKKVRDSLAESYKKFRGDKKPADVNNKIVIIVDDGIATGNTLLTAIRMILKKDPEKIVVAVPVAPVRAANMIKKEVDDFICLHILKDFIGVGFYYFDFSEVSDEEAIRLLKESDSTVKTV